MNGIALLLLTATLGVEYDWRTLEDGQIEYVLIVEPDLISPLAEGSEISSSVPAELESVQRLCIRIAQPANAAAPRQDAPRSLPSSQLRPRIGLRAGDPPTILWKAKGQPEETSAVRFGWQPTKDGLQQYFVQIDPKFLRTLAPGDEIYTAVSTEAGRVDTFVVFSNAKQLPKIPGKPVNGGLARGAQGAAFPGTALTGATAPGVALPGSKPPLAPAANAAPSFGAPNPLGPAPLPSAPLAADTSSPAFGPLGNTSPAFSTPPLANNSTLDRPAPFSSPGSFGNDPNSRVNPAANYDQPATGSTFGSNFPPSTTRPNLNPPNLNTQNQAPPLANSNPYTSEGFRNNEGYRGTEGYRGNELRASDPRDPLVQQPDGYGQAQTNPRSDLYPAGSGAYPNQTPYLNPTAPGVRNNTAPLPNGPLATTLPNGSTLPGNAPYRPSVGYPQDSQLQPAAYDNRPVGGSQQADYRPATQDNQLASRDLNTVRPGTRSELPLNQVAATTPPEKPWWPLVFMAFGLFVSIGANFYLGWTAAEFYSRYKLAVERLRTSSRA